MRLAQRAHGGYKRANILIIFRTANSEPCFLGLLSVTPENGACQHPVPLPTCFRTDSPRPSSPGPSQQGPQSLQVPRFPSRSDPLRPGPYVPALSSPVVSSQVVSSQVVSSQVVSSPVVSHRSVRTPVFGRSLSGPQPGPSRDNSQSAQALRQTVLWRFAGSGPSASQAVVATVGGLFSSAPRRASPGLDTSVGVQNLVPRSVPTPRSCGKSVTNAESFEQFRGREVTACGGIFPDFATVLHGFGTRIGPDLSGAEICGCNPKFIPTNRPSSVPQGLSPFQIRPLPSVKRRQGFTIPNREL